MAGKLVTLKLDGNLEQVGFRATLEIGLEGHRPEIEVLGTLPPNPALLGSLQDWQQRYHNLKSQTRIRPQEIVYLGSIQPIEACLQCAQTLRQQLERWMASEAFRSIDQALREELQRDDTIRVLIRSVNPQLHQMPWHLWDVVDRYPNAEVALGPLAFDRYARPTSSTPTPTVKILAILGHSAGINVAIDQQLLKALPQAEVTFLVEPQRRQINEQLWNTRWDILFFAGHSETLETTGRISINPHESLSLEELKYGLRQAIGQGLQLAIFNSCDGLGLAYELKELGLPHMIVMREPVPDHVAQGFLQHFLHSYASGSSFYLAERQARERLQGLEGEFPCASWLPVIFQTTAEAPPDWQQLMQPRSTPVPGALPEKTAPSLPVALLISIVVAAAMGGLRWLGVLQPLELNAFDRLMAARPSETLPERIVVVEATEADINEYSYPLPDEILATAIEKLQRYRPRVIGLDIFRDRLDPNHPGLGALLRKTNNLIALCSVRTSEDPNQAGIAPPAGVPEERLGFSNVVVDPDGVVRRQLLFMEPDRNSPCATRFSLSTLVALHYLEAENIHPENLEHHRLQLGKTIFSPLESNTGVYRKFDDRGFQVLLNYAQTSRSVRTIGLSALLQDRAELTGLEGKVILLGVTAPISNPTDYFLTPLSASQWPQERTSGVFVQAEMARHLIAAALEGRPVLRTWPKWGEGLWLVSWSVLGGILGGRISRVRVWGLGLGLGVLLLYGICLGLLVQGFWVPLVPTVLSFLGSSSGLIVYRIKHSRSSSGRTN